MQIVQLCIFNWFPFLLAYFDVIWDRQRMRVTDNVVAIAPFLSLASNHEVSIKLIIKDNAQDICKHMCVTCLPLPIDRALPLFLLCSLCSLKTLFCVLSNGDQLVWLRPAVQGDAYYLVGVK